MMWRWVTRGLVLTVLTALCVPALFAQLPTGFVGVLDFPDPNATQSGVVLVKGWAYDPLAISRIDVSRRSSYSSVYFPSMMPSSPTSILAKRLWFICRRCWIGAVS